MALRVLINCVIPGAVNRPIVAIRRNASLLIQALQRVVMVALRGWLSRVCNRVNVPQASAVRVAVVRGVQTVLRATYVGRRTLERGAYRLVKALLAMRALPTTCVSLVYA